VSGFSPTLSIQQPDRAFDRRGTQVHVPLRRDQILMPGELLNRPRRRAAHGQMRAVLKSMAGSCLTTADTMI
jgi:hypothetical protein